MTKAPLCTEKQNVVEIKVRPRLPHPMAQCSLLFPVQPVNFHFWEVRRYYDTGVIYGL